MATNSSSDICAANDYGDDVFQASSQSTPLLESPPESPRKTKGAQLREKDPEFFNLVMSVERAMEQGICPERIVQGSSGSYFCKNQDKVKVGVFKPKNEEPYGHLNPKWTKYMQKVCCPCAFGRSCLILNQGYLSEAGASTVDLVLGLGVVPKTRVVWLVSDAFYYSKFDRARAQAVQSAVDRFPDSLGRHVKRAGLPPKVGSFQTFVTGYRDAYLVLRKLNLDALEKAARRSLQLQFERMVVLDYLIRNTDRGNDNWLIKLDEPEGGPVSVTIAAIDNGLAFPFKHPDNWRAYPYHWAWLPMAQLPFSQENIEKLLPMLSDEDLIESLCDQLYALFSKDPGFSRSMFEQQMAVLRGQALNLRRALQDKMSPADLVKLPTAKLFLEKDRNPSATSFSEGLRQRQRRYQQILSSRLPFFKSW